MILDQEPLVLARLRGIMGRRQGVHGLDEPPPFVYQLRAVASDLLVPGRQRIFPGPAVPLLTQGVVALFERPPIAAQVPVV